MPRTTWRTCKTAERRPSPTEVAAWAMDLLGDLEDDEQRAQHLRTLDAALFGGDAA